MKEKPMKTIKQTEEVEAVDALADNHVDTSEIPEWTENDFSSAVRLNGRPVSEVMKLFKVRKAPITARIDLDVLEWLKSQGEGYQSRLNNILRDAMQKDIQHHHK